MGERVKAVKRKSPFEWPERAKVDCLDDSAATTTEI
jgi:hypothetical protein